MRKNNSPGYLLKRKEQAQASIEFALLVPFIMIIILAVSQVGMLLYQKNVIEQAAREGVRVVAVTNSSKEAEKRIEKICKNLNRNQIKIEIDPGSGRKIGDIVEVKIIYKPEGFTSIIGKMINKDFLIGARSFMRMECY